MSFGCALVSSSGLVQPSWLQPVRESVDTGDIDNASATAASSRFSSASSDSDSQKCWLSPVPPAAAAAGCCDLGCLGCCALRDFANCRFASVRDCGCGCGFGCVLDCWCARCCVCGCDCCCSDCGPQSHRTARSRIEDLDRARSRIEERQALIAR